MRINQWMETPVEFLPGITQEAVPQSNWPYRQDWIVSHVAWDSGNRMYWIRGHFHDGRTFFWGQNHRLSVVDGIGCIKLDWRYDLTNATYSTGRHETASEAIAREIREREELHHRQKTQLLAA